jgi:uncharacterized membrane protein YraQ (UPF0718 family)
LNCLQELDSPRKIKEAGHTNKAQWSLRKSKSPALGKRLTSAFPFQRGHSVENSAYLDAVKDFILTFVSILYEAMPFIVLGAIVAGILEEFIPQRWITKLVPKSRFLAILIGGLLGLVFPMCECGIIPVMRRLLRKGLPLSCCVAYLLAGPIINGVVMLSTYVAFSNATYVPGQGGLQMTGFWMMALRVGLGYLVAIGTSLIVEWQYRIHGNKLLAPLAIPSANSGTAEDEEEKSKLRKPFHKRIVTLCEVALHDFTDIMVYLVLGAIIASLLRQVLDLRGLENSIQAQTWLAAWLVPYIMPSITILMMMGLAIVLCLCSEADAFVAASFRTLPAASKLGFLVLGPMLDFKLYFMYTRVFRPRLIWTIILSVVVQVFIWSMVTHFVWKESGYQLLQWEQSVRESLSLPLLPADALGKP